MPDLQKGYAFSGTSPNNSVTAEKLNTLVDSATILPGFYTGKGEITSSDPADFLLVYEAASASYRKIKNGNLITAARGLPGAVNLSITWSTNSAVVVTADYLLMRDAGGALHLAADFNGTADLGLGIGVNGLDSGTEAADTWYYIYAISDGTNDRCLFTASPVAPQLPTGYSYSCLLGAARNDASANLRYFHQRGPVVAHELVLDGAATGDARNLNPKTGAADFTSIAPAAADTFHSVDLSRCVPPDITASVQGLIGLTGATGARRMVGVAGSSTGASLASPGTATGLRLAYLNEALAVSGGSGALATLSCGFRDVFSFEVPLRTSQQIVWASNALASIHSMRITGYTLAL